MDQDMTSDAFDSSFSTHASPQAPMKPTPPPLHVLPKPNDVGLSLVKPTSTHAEATQALLGWPKLAAWVETVAEEIKAA